MLRGPRYSRFTKPALDFVLSIGALIVTLPILVVALITVAIHTQSNPLFRQKRVGLNGRIFVMYKITTMKSIHDKQDPNFTEINDPRITSIGRLLRRTKIDELPQLMNVLKGDMSLVGPRPEQTEFASEFSENIANYDLRHKVKPGITGLAQLQIGYTSTIEETRLKCLADLEYIEKMSFALDTRILLATVKMILFRNAHR